MDPIQQRLQAVYQRKPESDIDRKLKSASTTVLDQRIAFHDASKVTTCPNSQLKGKYLFMKPSKNMEAMKASSTMQTMKPNGNSVPGHTVTPVKKDSDSKNNNATKTPPNRDKDHQHISWERERKVQSRKSPHTRSSRNRSPLTRKSRSRSPLARKSRSRSPLARKSRSRSPLTRKSRSRSPVSRRSRSRSPLSRKSRSRSPLARKSRSRSPISRKSRSRSPISRKSRSRSPLARKSRSRVPVKRKSRSRSPFARKSRSRSPLTRKSRSRSPLKRKSRSRSPLARKSRSRSPLARKSKSKSPLTRKCRSRAPLKRKARSRSPREDGKKRKKKTYLTPFYVEDSDSENEVDVRPDESMKHTSKMATISILPYFNLAQKDKTNQEKIPVFKNRIDTFEKVIIPPSGKESSTIVKETEKQTNNKDTVISKGTVEKNVNGLKNKHEKMEKNQKKTDKKLAHVEKNEKQTAELSKDDSEATGKTKEGIDHLIAHPMKETEPSPGPSLRPDVEVVAAEASMEKRENKPEKKSSKREEVIETFDWVDFKQYLPDNFDDLSYYPSDEEVARMFLDLDIVVPQEDGDNMPRPNTVLFPEHRLDYSWKFPEGGCGLINRGNTCFVNAALQCLTYCPPFVNYLLSGQHAQDCRMMKKERCILCSFTRYLHESLKMTNKHNLVPNWFLNNLYCVAKHFSLGRQEDSHEYLRLSLEQMQKVCLVGHNQLDRYSKETTVVNQIFGGFLRSQVVCLKCKAKSNTYDPFLDISLDIRTCNTLERAFEIFVHPEKLDIENAYKCANCKQKVEALKRFTIHKAPNILTVQLKRFQATHDDKFGGHFRGVKINKAIKFPPRLNIRGYMSNRNGPPELYSLYALLFHEGHSANSGHYTCTVKSGSKWFHISDGSKIRTSLHTVDLQDVYVLFYMREDKQQNGIIQNPTLNTNNNKGKDFKEAQRQQSSFTSPSGVQRSCASGVPKMSPSGGQKFIGPVKPKIIHNNEYQFKPVKTNTNSGAPGNDIGTPVKRKDMTTTPQKPDSIKVPLAADRNKVSFGIKTPGKAHPPTSSSSSAEKPGPHSTNPFMSKSHSEPVLSLAKPRIVMQIKNGKATTIEKSPDGRKKILSDDEEVVASMSEKKAHKKVRKSVLVPYGNESSTDSDTDSRQGRENKVKRERKEENNGVVFDTKLNATTSVPGNIHLMKNISGPASKGEANRHKEKEERVEKLANNKGAILAELNKSTDSIHSERHVKHAQNPHEEKRSVDKPAKTEVNTSNNCHANYNGHHVYMKHRNGEIHIYDSPIEDKHEVKHHKDIQEEDKHHIHSNNHGHNSAKKRKLIEDARIDIVNGEFHVVSDKKPLLISPENGHHEKQYKDSEEYRLLKKAKKHKKHKKDKHRHKEHKYETLLNESDSRHYEEDHHVKKHKKKKRKHKERGYDIEEEHSYKKRHYDEEEDHSYKKRHHEEEEDHSYKKKRYEEHGEGRGHKHYHHHGDSVENKVHKRQRQESESSSSGDFEWVEKKIDTPVKHSKSAAW